MKFKKDNSDTALTEEMVLEMEKQRELKAKEHEKRQKEQKERQEKEMLLRNRMQAYGSIGEQLDMLWHDMNEGRIKIDKGYANTWYQSIKTAKENNPLAK